MSIQLANAAVLNINGVVAESDPAAALYYMEVSFPSSCRLFYGYGSTTATTFTGGKIMPAVIVSLNLMTGFWQSNNGLSGAVSGVGFTTAQSDFVTLANLAETLVVNTGAIVGTQIPWTTAVY